MGNASALDTPTENGEVLRLTWRDEGPEVFARAPARGFTFGSLTEALKAEPTYQTEWGRTSILDAVLGLVPDPSQDEGRLLAFVDAVGVGWTRQVLHEPVPEDGATLGNLAAVDVTRRALIVRAADARACERAAEVFLLDTSDREGSPTDEEAEEAGRMLDQLTSSVRVRAEIDGDLNLVYESPDLFALAAVELLILRQSRAICRRCRHCRRLYVTRGRADEAYCRRSAPDEPPGGRTCQALGPVRSYAANLDPLTALYRAESKRLDQRMRRGAFDKRALDSWRKAARDALGRARAEAWSAERYRQALAAIDPLRQGD